MTDNDSTSNFASEPPTTALLERILARAAEIVIIEASADKIGHPGAARIAISGSEIAELTRLLAIVDGGTGGHCRCLGWPTILVRDTGGNDIAQWTLHHRTNIRGLGNCDAELRDGPDLTEWLADHGLTRSREAQRRLARQQAEAEQRRTHWVQAAPPALADAAESASRREDGAEANLTRLIAVQHPETTERIRTLLAWAGFPSRQKDGTPWYELAPQRLLLAEPADSIFDALASTPPTPAQLDGAADLFTSFEWTTAYGTNIPQPLKTQLISHVESTGTDPMKFRMHHGYGTARSD